MMRLFLSSIIVPSCISAYMKIGDKYEPDFMMADPSAMDLDQNAIVFHLLLNSDDGFGMAQKIYANGGYTNNYAVLKLKGSNIPSKGIERGAKIIGQSVEGVVVTGEAHDDMEPGQTTLEFRYPTFDLKPPKHVNCIVGVLPSAWQTHIGCLKESGTLSIDGIGPVNYTYSLQFDNKSGRSFRGWSTMAGSTMGSCSTGCPYSDFTKFRQYYGQSAYADEWIAAALTGRATNFPKKGNADFSRYGFAGRTEAVMNGIAYISDPMMTLRQLEYAASACESATSTAAGFAWDLGVAYYTGSWALGEPGMLMYSLAEKRCQNFKTCGREADKIEGTSYVNLQMYDLFTLGQYHLSRSYCDQMRDIVDRATALMSIPVIQSTLRYAYKIGMGADTSERAMAQGAVFAAGVLPRVYACSEVDASTIYDNMKVGAPSTDFYAVLSAFENNYECLGISDWEVGALYDEELNGGQGGTLYIPKYQAVGKESVESANEEMNVIAVGVGVGVGIFVLILIILVVSRREKKPSIDAPTFVNSDDNAVI